MTKQTTKQGLLDDIVTERRQLEKNLSGINDSEKLVGGVCGDWSIKDILAHLTAWESMFMGWYEAGLRNEIPAIPAPGYSWHAMNQLNQQIYEVNSQRVLRDIETEFAASYQEVLSLVRELPEDAIFTHGYYGWTKHLTLADYIAANTCNHYRWAKTLIRKWQRSRIA